MRRGASLTYIRLECMEGNCFRDFHSSSDLPNQAEREDEYRPFLVRQAQDRLNVIISTCRYQAACFSYELQAKYGNKTTKMKEKKGDLRDGGKGARRGSIENLGKGQNCLKEYPTRAWSGKKPYPMSPSNLVAFQ